MKKRCMFFLGVLFFSVILIGCAPAVTPDSERILGNWYAYHYTTDPTYYTKDSTLEIYFFYADKSYLHYSRYDTNGGFTSTNNGAYVINESEKTFITYTPSTNNLTYIFLDDNTLNLTFYDATATLKRW